MKILICGLPKVGKTCLAEILIRKIPCVYFNGDVVRMISNDTDFSAAGRAKQAFRMRELCQHIHSSIIVIADFQCPSEQTRRIFNADRIVWVNNESYSPHTADTMQYWERPSQVNLEVTGYDFNVAAQTIAGWVH